MSRPPEQGAGGSPPPHDDQSKELALPTLTTAERALELGAAVSSLAPVLGGVVANVLSGVAGDRRFERVRKLLLDLASKVETLNEAQEQYVKSEDFEDLLIETMERVWRERNEEKRRIYRDFIADAIQFPGKAHDEQIRFLRILEALQGEHFRLMKALLREPSGEEMSSMMGSPLRTLSQRLPNMSENMIDDLMTQLNDLHLTNLGDLRITMTGQGAADLRSTVTPLGQRFVRFLRTSR